MAWSDRFGHAQGKRIPAAQFLGRARGTGFAFCEASLGWNTDGTVIDSLRLTNWEGGYPDVYAVPDLATFQLVPWRPRVGHVIADIVAHDRSPSLLDPRAVLKRVLARLEGLGYTAKIGVGTPSSTCSTPTARRSAPMLQRVLVEKADALDPLITDLYETLGAFTRLEGIQTEYGPRSGGNQPGLHRCAGCRRRRGPAEVRREGGRPQARQARQLHGQAVLRTFWQQPASAHLVVARWRTGIRGHPRRGERPGAACDRGPARASAVDHVVRRALGQRLSPVRARFALRPTA